MANQILGRIKDFLLAHPSPAFPKEAMMAATDMQKLGYTPRVLFPPASAQVIEKAEKQMGLRIPPLLRSVYSEVSNGISGFCYDIIGVGLGCRSDFGNLVKTRRKLKECVEFDGGEWNGNLLPFCYWGCVIYSCVDCNDPGLTIYTFDEDDAYRQTYTLYDFFEMWVSGTCILDQDKVDTAPVEIINPFTKQKATIYRTKRKK